MTLKGIGNQKV